MTREFVVGELVEFEQDGEKGEARVVNTCGGTALEVAWELGARVDGKWFVFLHNARPAVPRPGDTVRVLQVTDLRPEAWCALGGDYVSDERTLAQADMSAYRAALANSVCLFVAGEERGTWCEVALLRRAAPQPAEPWVPKVGDLATGHNVFSWRHGESNPYTGNIEELGSYYDREIGEYDYATIRGIHCALESVRPGNEVAPVPKPSAPPREEAKANSAFLKALAEKPKADPYATHREAEERGALTPKSSRPRARVGHGMWDLVGTEAERAEAVAKNARIHRFVRDDSELERIAALRRRQHAQTLADLDRKIERGRWDWDVDDVPTNVTCNGRP